MKYSIMRNIILGLSLLLSMSSAGAQGNPVFPPAPAANPSVGTMPMFGYYPNLPYYPAYPTYPLAQPYYIQPQAMPMGAYPRPYPNMAALPNMQPNLPAAPVYTSPYNSNQPAMPGPKPAPAPQPKKETKPWGDTRYIWPDFYTEQTSDMWDKMINAPHDMGYMPGGWRFPSFSSPDPVTVGDAVANQVPPIMEEVPNFMNFTN